MGDILLSLIAARAQNGVIGKDGQLPWRLSDDLAFFKSVTTGKPVLMGRRTWESLPVRPLPGRANFVLTSDWNYDARNARVYSSFLPALNAARATAARAGADELFVIGGAQLYERALPLADRLYLTEVDADIDGDTYFPAFAPQDWAATELSSHAADDRNEFAFRVVRYDRKQR